MALGVSSRHVFCTRPTVPYDSTASNTLGSNLICSPFEPTFRHPGPSIATAPQTPKPPLVFSTSSGPTLLVFEHVPSPRCGRPGAHVPSELLTTYRTPRYVMPPEKSARPQCQIRTPGEASVLMHAAAMLFGGAQGVVTTLLVRFGGFEHPSIQ